VAHLCDSRRGWATGRASPILATDQRRVAHRLCRHHEPGQVHCGSNISVYVTHADAFLDRLVHNAHRIDLGR
jgi:hypothetical protein